MRLRVLRTLAEYEYDILPIFLYNAIPQDNEEDLLDISVIREERFQKYIEKFGKEDDYAIVWEKDGQIAGLAWTRLFDEANKGFAYISDDIPELTVSILPGYNVQKISAELIEVISNELRIKGYDKVSVSVSENDEMLDVYTKYDFVEKEKQDDNRVLLVKELN